MAFSTRPMNRRARVVMTTELLASKLGLPPGTTIVQLDMEHSRDIITLYVKHEDLPPAQEGVESLEVGYKVVWDISE